MAAIPGPCFVPHLPTTVRSICLLDPGALALLVLWLLSARAIIPPVSALEGKTTPLNTEESSVTAAALITAADAAFTVILGVSPPSNEVGSTSIVTAK